MRELEERGFAPPSLLIPQRADKENVEPPGVKAMLHEAAATVIAKADEALAVTAASIGCDPPAQSDLAAWIGAGHCPPETLGATAPADKSKEHLRAKDGVIDG